MKLALIATLYQRHENTFPILHRVLVDSTRKPDEIWWMCEGMDDVDEVIDSYSDLYDLELILERAPGKNESVIHLPTPENVIPYSHKINYALDRSDADLFVYLDNGSMPSPYKYEVMAAALEENEKYGAVYVTQKRTGFQKTTFVANKLVSDAYSQLNYTQVMHRRTPDRWTLDMKYANPDVADGLFWRSLHESLGPFYPVGGSTPHDEHHIPSPAATGI